MKEEKADGNGRENDEGMLIGRPTIRRNRTDDDYENKGEAEDRDVFKNFQSSKDLRPGFMRRKKTASTDPAATPCVDKRSL